MFPAVNGEVLAIVVESRRIPGVLRVTRGAIGRELGRQVVGVARLRIIEGMASVTGIGRIVVIAVMAGGTVRGNGCVRSLQHVIVVVVGKGRRHPVGRRSMTGCAVGGKAQRVVIGVCGLVIIGCMAGRTGGRRILIAV